MSKKLYLSLGALAVIAIIVFVIFKFAIPNPNKDETKTIYCGPDKTNPVNVFINPSNAFPTFAKDYNLKLNAGIEVLDSLKTIPQLKGSAGTDYNTKIVELREKLNQESIRMEMIMKSNFLAYNMKPCDSAVNRDYFALLKMMAEKNSELEKFKAGLTVPISKGNVDSAQIKIVTDTALISNALGKFSENYKFEQ